MKILKYRILGIFPLLFFSIKAIDCYNRNALFDLLWFCNITNLFLGLAISFGVLRFVWFFTLANLVGIAPWLFGLTIGIEFLYTSLLVHLVSPIIGIYILKKSDVKYQLWSYGFFYLFLLQIVSRFSTPYRENVNIAFYVYPELIPYFFNYPVYWAANTIGLGISFYIIEKIITKVLK
ncbi:MAG: hypothetical protein H7A23_04790 [Leptospiraceae bacterium]|nr:hypothetical protein [Leptospiraceae bacterium]MCP5493852.1 hypothetical protein [Leptospiraceae bacterium]